MHHSSLFVATLLSLAPAVAGAAPGFVVSGLDGVPTEEGGMGSFTVTLTEPPGGDVFVDTTSSDPDEVFIFSVDPSPFNNLNWNVPKRFWAIGVDDEVEDGDVPIELYVEALPGSLPAYIALGETTIKTTNYDDEETMTFHSPAVRCIGATTEDIYDGGVISLLYSPAYDPSDPFVDDRVFAENSDGEYLELRTLHVVLQNTMTRVLTNPETEVLRRYYARAVHRIHTTSRGMVDLNFHQVVIPSYFGIGSFIDDDPGSPGMQAAFVDYGRLKIELANAGFDYEKYDMISISVGFTDTDTIKRTEVAYAVAPELPIDLFPYSNSNTWDNDKTMTTVQYTTDPESEFWIDIFIHEMFHNLEWMLEYGSFPELRNPDDPWWLATYSYSDVMDMFWARPKTDYFFIPAPWGSLHTQLATHIVEMSCPAANTYKERRVYCPNGVTCGVGCQCNAEGPPRG
ncbi:hypothetical protein [Nannocystis sp. SCPEA4]|uniref:hypothetical protein n=1 Tax=Nannocystis sp. SCPEA4 TaxID=2996787 RepID=UPI00226F2ACA|nr:hypothetical protein [Nannocystis sp. SCPEA4]MCY1062796.1 hypothetical protein [Nannocystis sp. SCPEA4]